MFKSSILFLLCSFFVLTLQAKYELTTWGMSFAKVKKLYTGGRILKQQNGETTYGVVRPVASLSTAYLLFKFPAKSGLSEVTILFPKQGTDVDLRTGLYEELTLDDGKAIFNTLKAALIFKYGKPDDLSKEDKFVWTSQDGDAVFLNLNKRINTDHSTVGIIYQKIPSLESLSKGL